MKIREATTDDIIDLMPLAVDMHEESRFRVMKFSVEKMDDFLRWCIVNDDCLLIVAETNDGEIAGAFAGFCMEQWFSTDKYACDFALFVHPGYRGSTASWKLISHYVGWAGLKEAKLIQLGISTGVNPDEIGRFYEKLGFKRFGGLYEWGR